MELEIIKQTVKDVVVEQIKAAGESISAGLDEKLDEKVDAAVQTAIKAVKAELIKAPDLGGEQKEDPKGGFKCLSDYATVVRKACARDGQAVDQRLLELNKKAAGDAMNEGSSEYGGYLVPEEFRQQLMQQTIEKSNIIARTMVIPMATNSINIPTVQDTTHASGTVYGGIKFYWLEEEGEKTETKPKLGSVNLRLKKTAGLCYVTDELLQDSPISMEPMLNQMFTDALAWTLDSVFLNGTGAGQPLGIINAPCLIQVAKETGQQATTLIFENIIKMFSRVSNKSNCSFIANPDCFSQLASMSLSVGTGGAPVWLPAGGVSGKPFDTLMGRPLEWSEHCRSVGSLGDIYLCDWSQYLVGQKAGSAAGIQFAQSIHLKFDYDQTAYRFVFRVDGQPLWKSAQTPQYSSSTISPFVATAVRA